MFKLGTYQTLNVARITEYGYFLQNTSSKTDGEVLLPNKLALRELQEGENVRVFLYKDGEERVTATMQDPDVTLNEVAFLKVKDANDFGAYLDWGLDKDLFVPHSEQIDTMREGQQYLVYMYLDEQTNRLAATTRLDRFMESENITVEEGEKVDLWIWKETDLGYKVVINNTHEGLVYHNEFFEDIFYGDKTVGWIKQVRDDNKIDVTLRPIGYDKVEPNAQHILERLRHKDGYLDLHDKSDPEKIHNRLEMSKKTFKKAIGRLYKKEIIRIEDDGIYLR
ncbi:CvfB family protein [Fodinibius halophilus]|uniref:GntR family transcriptional regulator n=1 Tax=Fodinibius halophilus TaxID=1736908 RepID=A0A6M1T034_9BACT|nr:S1-like domain-containing RNA-binding protein [Fodinibius halophilus]NGP88856.1 GntR family transcriptional regulator [Fodinibius halophilus]